MAVPKAWLADLRLLISSGTDRNSSPDKPVLGILAFEAAATMARLVCLYRSLSSSEVQRLRSETMRSQGVAYLNSTDQFFLLCLACAEFMTELDRAAAAVARIGHRCTTGAIPHGPEFDRFYTELKSRGVSPAELARLGLGSSSKSVDKKIAKMERYVGATSKLYEELELLNEFEAKEQRQWRQHSGPIPTQKPVGVDGEAVDQLRLQNSKVKRLKDESLWSKSFDRAVELTARAVVTVFARICAVFSPAVPGLPDANNSNSKHNSSRLNFPIKHFCSGPLERRPAAKEIAVLRNSAPIYIAKAAITNTLLGKWGKLLDAPPKTVGASGLALRYANVIALAEKLMRMRCGGGDEFDEDEEASAREELYEMIPMAIRGALKAKLSECWRTEREAMDGRLAEGWRDGAEKILEWLGPVAKDSLRWQEERNMDRRQRFDTEPRTLLLQTLHFSDEVKVEAAIVEVLVGLSCMYWHTERCSENKSVLSNCIAVN